MLISELQEAPNERMYDFGDMIKNAKRQWEEGRMQEATYHSQLALFYANMKNVNECKLHASQVPDTAEDQDKMEAYIALARMHVYENKIDEAISYYEKTLQIEPDHEIALEEMAFCYYHLKQYTEAEKWFEKAVVVSPELEDLWDGFGMSASYQMKYTTAIPYFTKAKELQLQRINDHYYEYMIGLCYENEKDFYRALSHYFKSLDAKPSFAQSLNNIAALYFEHEADIKTAISYLQKAETIATEEEDTALQQMVYLNLMKLYEMIKEYELRDLYQSKLLRLLGLQESLDEE